MKNASAMYANAVPNIVEQTKNALLQSNLNYQKDLNEVAVDRRQEPRRPRKGNRRRHGADLCQRVHRAGTEGPGDFYKSPLGQKLLATEPQAIQFSMAYMNQWAQHFCRNGQRPVPRRDEEARQGNLIESKRSLGLVSMQTRRRSDRRAGLIWLSSTSICLSSVAVRAACAPPASPPAMAPGSWSPKNTGWAAPA